MKKEITLKSGSKLTLSDEDFETIKEQFKEDKGDRWKPEKRNRYYLVNQQGTVSNYNWIEDSDETDLWLYSQRNVWKTQEEAQQYKSYLEAVAKIKDSATLKPDWEDNNQEKYCIYYNHDTNSLGFYTAWSGQVPYHALYKTQDDAKQAIKTLKKEYELVFEWERNHG